MAAQPELEGRELANCQTGALACSTGTLGNWADNNIPNFGGTVGSVTVSGLITADALKFLTQGYTLAASASPVALTLGNALPTVEMVTTGSGGMTANISNALSAANMVSFNKSAGTGVHDFNLNVANTFSSGITLNTVRLNANAAGALGSGSVTLAGTGSTISSTTGTSTFTSGLIDLTNSFLITGSTAPSAPAPTPASPP